MSRACGNAIGGFGKDPYPPLPLQQLPIRIRQETTTEALLCLESYKYQVPEIRIVGSLTRLDSDSQVHV